MEKQPNRSTPVLPVYIALGVLVLFVVVFALEFARSSGSESGAPIIEELTTESYMDIVTPLLADADPERGAVLVQRNGCTSCHEGGVNNRLAPPYEGLGVRAANQRPPLQAAAYLYESIVHPTAYEVTGYTGEMPRTYGELSDQDLGDIIAYLLTK